MGNGDSEGSGYEACRKLRYCRDKVDGAYRWRRMAAERREGVEERERLLCRDNLRMKAKPQVLYDRRVDDADQHALAAWPSDGSGKKARVAVIRCFSPAVRFLHSHNPDTNASVAENVGRLVNRFVGTGHSLRFPDTGSQRAWAGPTGP